MAAGRKPAEQVPLADLALTRDALTARTTVTSFVGYIAERRHVLIADGDAREKVALLMSGLAQEGVI